MGIMVREQEISRSLALVEADGAAPLVVVGPRGSGLSTVLNEVAERSALPATVLGVSRAESGWPLSGLSAVLAAIDAAQGSSLSLHPTLLNPDVADFARAQALTAEVRKAVTRPMLLVINDADEVDEVSRRALGFLLRRLGGSRLRVVVGVAPLPAGDALEGLPTLQLQPVPVPELAALGRSVHGTAADRAVLDYIARISSGRPLVFLSFLEELPAEVRGGVGPIPVPLKSGPVLTDVVGGTLRDLGEQGEAVLRALGTSFYLPAPVAAALPEVTVEGIQELEGRGIITRSGEDYEVTDPAAVLVAYWSTPTDRRVRAHEALHRAADGIDEGLHAWHASHLSPAPAQATPLLTVGIEQIARGDLTLGIRLVERALSLAPIEQLACEVESLVRELLLAAEVDHARRYLSMLLAVGEGVGPSPATAGMRVVLDAIQRQRSEPCVVREAVAAFADTDPEGCRALLLAAAGVRLYRFELGPAEQLIAEARELGGADDPMVAHAEAMAGLYRAALAGEELPSLPVRRTHVEREGGHVARTLNTVFVARALGAADRYDTASPLLENVIETASSVPRLVLILALDSLSAIEMRAGRVGRARHAAEQLGTSESLCGPFPLNQLLQLAELAIFDGDHPAAHRHLRELVRRAGPGSSLRVRTRAVLHQGRLALAEGDAVAAVRFLRRGAHLGAHYRNPSLHRYHDLLVEALHAAGRHGEAREALEELAALAEEFPSRWASRALARSRAVLREDPGVLAHYADLLATWPPGQDEMLRVRTLLAHASALAAHGQGHRAIQERRAAGELLLAAGARRPIESVTGTVGPERTSPGIEDLDEKERPVVERVLRGYTNQAIARELFLSVRTVEMRLTGVYRRFEVSSRAELIALLRGGTTSAGGEDVR